MDQNEHPRANEVVGVYSYDKVWGIVIIVLTGLGACGSLFLGGLGAAVGTVGAGSLATGANGTADGRAAAAAVGAGGGLLAMIGFIMAAVFVAQLVGGIGILKSLRWGFLVTGGFAALGVLLSLVHLNIIGIILHGGFLAYCAMRLTGKLGAAPL